MEEYKNAQCFCEKCNSSHGSADGHETHSGKHSAVKRAHAYKNARVIKGKVNFAHGAECECCNGGHDHSHQVHDDGLSCGCEHCREKTEQALGGQSSSVFFAYRFDLTKIFLSAILIVVAFLVKSDVAKLIIFIAAAVICGYELAINCVKNVIKGKIFDENTLMLIASVTAFCLGEYFEGAFIVTLFALGEALEGLATANSRKKIAGLAQLKSTIAHLVNNNGISDVLPEEVAIGSLIEIRKGERVPVDGVLVGACVELDTKAITGESKYYAVNNGEEILSGSVNVGDAFVMKTTKLYKDSTVERIIAMVEGATSKKARSQKFITAFAKIYTPIVFGVAIIIAGVIPLFDQMNFVKWIYKSLSFLVVSCPCALVISVPLAYFVGIGSLAKNGILIKGSNCLEALAGVKKVVFDKTGTLTKGEFTIDKTETAAGENESYIFELVYALESKSNHPISKVLVKELADRKKFEAEAVSEIAGHGLVGTVDGKHVAIGNIKLMEKYSVSLPESDFAGTVLYVSVDSKHVQTIYLTDKVKEGSVSAIENLRNVGVSKTFMLSGDNKKIAEKLGSEVGIDSVYSQLLPEDKLNIFEKISAETTGKTMYVGDGINDSPTLSVADVGVAMGGLGSEIAVDSSDVVIMDDDIRKIPVAIRYSKKIRRIVITNIVGSLAIKFAIMLLSVVTYMPIWIAMFGDVGVMLLAIINSLLGAKVKK